MIWIAFAIVIAAVVLTIGLVGGLDTLGKHIVEANTDEKEPWESDD